MSKSGKHPTIAFGKRKRIDISKFNGKIYLHFNDLIKDKSISLSKEEYDLLFKLRNKISKKIEEVKKLGEGAKGDKRNKKKRKSPSDSSSEDDNMATSSSESD